MNKSASDSSLRRSLIISGISHGFGVAIFFVFVFWRAQTAPLLEFEVIQNPTSAPNLKPLQIEKPKPREKAPEKRAIFGVTRTALKDSSLTPGSPAIKTGNTIAKNNDTNEIKHDDAVALPIPTDEYLVSEMPKLKTEVRIPYPAEAKKAGVQGPVLFDLLIDASGKVREAVLIRGPGYGLNEAALSAVKNFEFTSARVQEKAVAVRIRYAYRFILQR